MDNRFKRRHFAPAIILLTVRWYPRYSLSYRDPEAGQTPAWQMQAQAQMTSQGTGFGAFSYSRRDVSLATRDCKS